MFLKKGNAFKRRKLYYKKSKFHYFIKAIIRKNEGIRLGMEQHLNITKYLDPLYSYWQMREIRLGRKANLDVSLYSSFMYTPKEMKKRRLILNNQKKFPELSYNWKMLLDANIESMERDLAEILRLSGEQQRLWKAYEDWKGR